ncbi:Metallo-dependent phosphatase-like protein [Haematococcus lacustris]
MSVARCRSLKDVRRRPFITVSMAWATLLSTAMLAASVGSHVPVQEVRVPGSLNFAVLGDWGRTGGIKSITPASEGGYDTTGSCTEYFAAKAHQNVLGAVGQASTARVMDKAIRLHQAEGSCKGLLLHLHPGPAAAAAAAAAPAAACDLPPTHSSSCGPAPLPLQAKFVVNTGDNFYECGIDTPMRVISDWASVYQGRRTPATANLTWYHTIGNHDVPRQSVAHQLEFGKQEPRWFLPSRYYTVDFTSEDNTTVRSIFINTSPFVTAYSNARNKYNGPEINTTNTPEALTAQLKFIEQALNTSRADWTIVVGHHPVVGAASTVYGFNTSGMPHTSFDLGMRTTTGTGAWAMLLGLLRTYNVTAYFNGHDHVLTHAVDPVDPVTYKTQYITTGAGSFADGADSCGAARPFLRYTNSGLPTLDCSTAVNQTATNGRNGFNIVKANKTSFEADSPEGSSHSAGLAPRAPSTLVSSGAQRFQVIKSGDPN